MSPALGDKRTILGGRLAWACEGRKPIMPITASAPTDSTSQTRKRDLDLLPIITLPPHHENQGRVIDNSVRFKSKVIDSPPCTSQDCGLLAPDCPSRRV